MSGPIRMDRAYDAVANAEPFLNPCLEYRKLLSSVWPIDELIQKSHRDWEKWVVYIETQFSSDRTYDPVIIALALTVNKIELPSRYQDYLVSAMQKYLEEGFDLENAFFGFKHKLSYDRRWRDQYRNRRYFYAMLMAQTLPGHSAFGQLESMIEPRDREKQASIYRYFSTWKKSREGRDVARMYERVATDFSSVAES